ncbi:unnamed protein product [Calicophoron daubneyi]|uniref:Uncharacterized protein n=1 Tax=Calicophoron daubneyi TaxID=300641 RepID=A0AAV2T107_CALDB
MGTCSSKSAAQKQDSVSVPHPVPYVPVVDASGEQWMIPISRTQITIPPNTTDNIAVEHKSFSGELKRGAPSLQNLRRNVEIGSDVNKETISESLRELHYDGNLESYVRSDSKSSLKQIRSFDAEYVQQLDSTDQKDGNEKALDFFAPESGVTFDRVKQGQTFVDSTTYVGKDEKGTTHLISRQLITHPFCPHHPAEGELHIEITHKTPVIAPSAPSSLETIKPVIKQQTSSVQPSPRLEIPITTGQQIMPVKREYSQIQEPVETVRYIGPRYIYMGTSKQHLRTIPYCTKWQSKIPVSLQQSQKSSSQIQSTKANRFSCGPLCSRGKVSELADQTLELPTEPSIEPSIEENIQAMEPLMTEIYAIPRSKCLSPQSRNYCGPERSLNSPELFLDSSPRISDKIEPTDRPVVEQPVLPVVTHLKKENTSSPSVTEDFMKSSIRHESTKEDIALDRERNRTYEIVPTVKLEKFISYPIGLAKLRASEALYVSEMTEPSPNETVEEWTPQESSEKVNVTTADAYSTKVIAPKEGSKSFGRVLFNRIRNRKQVSSNDQKETNTSAFEQDYPGALLRVDTNWTEISNEYPKSELVRNFQQWEQHMGVLDQTKTKYAHEFAKHISEMDENVIRTFPSALRPVDRAGMQPKSTTYRQSSYTDEVRQKSANEQQHHSRATPARRRYPGSNPQISVFIRTPGDSVRLSDFHSSNSSHAPIDESNILHKTPMKSTPAVRKSTKEWEKRHKVSPIFLPPICSPTTAVTRSPSEKESTETGALAQKSVALPQLKDNTSRTSYRKEINSVHNNRSPKYKSFPKPHKKDSYDILIVHSPKRKQT